MINNTIKKVVYSALCATLLCSSAYAAKLNITNTDSADIDLLIEGGKGAVVAASDSAVKMVLKKGEVDKTVEINMDTFKTDTFTVTGTVKAPSMDNKCKSLSVDKDYRITFKGASMGGTVCEAIEIAK
jgi:hypothetical protein